MKIQTLIRRVLVGPALCALAVAAPISHAGITAILNGTGFANGSESMTLSTGLPLAENPVPTGGFVGTFGGSPLTFWCGELNQTFSFGDPQLYTADIFTNSNLSRLFTEVSQSDRTSSTVNSAAFQLAVWEILFEGTTSTPYSLSSGDFKATGDSAALIKADGWLLNLGSFAASTILVSLTNASHQDFITDFMPPSLQTPEPGSLALLGVGMFALMFAVRRRT
jgi:PEP-CTERM motif